MKKLGDCKLLGVVGIPETYNPALQMFTFRPLWKKTVKEKPVSNSRVTPTAPPEEELFLNMSNEDLEKLDMNVIVEMIDNSADLEVIVSLREELFRRLSSFIDHIVFSEAKPLDLYNANAKTQTTPASNAGAGPMSNTNFRPPTTSKLETVKDSSKTMTAKSGLKMSKKKELADLPLIDLNQIFKTSADAEMIGACQKEFRRRMQIFDEWCIRTPSWWLFLPRHAPTTQSPLDIEQFGASHANNFVSKTNVEPTETTKSKIIKKPNETIPPKNELSLLLFNELRNMINTSTDMEMLVACKEEFHRRLNVYNQWKSSNSSRDVPSQTRAPSALYNASAQPSSVPHVNPPPSQHKYFKMPFNSKSGNVTAPSKMNATLHGESLGMWYAHFNGQWVHRQIHVKPNEKAELCTAGKDDLKMCELPLDKTGLARRKGAEISKDEFETIWTHWGGRPMANWTP